MDNELIPSISEGLSVGRAQERDRGPYPAPARWSAGAGLDRRAETRHVLAVREEVRRGELAQVREARRLAESVARLEAAGRYGLEAKLALETADRQSKLIAGDNPVLQQQFAVLDDTLFQAIRAEQIRRGLG